MNPESEEPTAPRPEDPPVRTTLVAVLGRALCVTGVMVMLAVAFQAWGTNVVTARAQDRLERELDEMIETASRNPPTTSTTEEPSDSNDPSPEPRPVEPITFDPAAAEAFIPEGGHAVARIDVEAIDLTSVVVEGSGARQLRLGPGHYVDSALPGHPGNVGIAGHRTTYGHPFADLDQLRPGDSITLTSPEGSFVYDVVAPTEALTPDQLARAVEASDGHAIVRPSDYWVLDDHGDARLTMTACHPKGTARQRIVVFAMLRDPSKPGPLEVGDADVSMTPPAASPSTRPTIRPPADPVPASAPVPDLAAGDEAQESWLPGAFWLVVVLLVVEAGWRLRGRFGRLRVMVAAAPVTAVAVAACIWTSQGVVAGW